ncbi:MAG: hypothetical protein ABIS50_21285 [Luteolibacter sp.]|uniref:hypothetical protein n=1 Tax=Luteolibacter sp. TaxID=1962973 RepID=UPI0032657F66
MKTPYAIGLVAASVLITVAVEESRISSLRGNMETMQSVAPAKAPATVSAAPAEEPGAPVKTKSRSELAPAAPVKEADTTEESFAKTARKMWDNPAGKSMMNQGVKMAIGMMYQDFVDGLNLSKEEGDYFKNLLGKEIADQQELGMKMMGATPEEQKTLAEELKKRGEDNEAEIKKFLNSDEDFKSFTDYKNHLPERQQLDGIRDVMSTKGAPLDADTEAKLVDAMYRARTESKAPDLSGPNAMDELAKGNIVETYEKSWEVQQEALRAETSKILNPTQMEAFQDYQKQAKEMQLMGLKMAEQMMSGKKKAAK